MRVGLLYETTGTSGDVTPIIEQIVEADRLGFDSLWIDDRHFDERGIGSAPIVLAALATHTRAIRLGTFKLLALDHPARVAEDFAMIDLLSGGRLNLGVTVGERPEYFCRYHVPFAERTARFREALEIVLAAWSSDAFAYGGRWYQFPAHTAPGSGLHRARKRRPPDVPQWERGPELPDALTVTPKPLQQPHPPVWVLADGVEMARFAAEHGHSVVLLPADTQEIEATASAYEAALAAAHRARSEVQLAVVADLQIEGARLAATTLESLHELNAATGMQHVIWRMDPTVPHETQLAALGHFAAEVQPLLQA